jgi:SPP1 family predicted phage head-tail adaptor
MIGKMDSRINILQKSVVRDDIGGETITYNVLKTTWCSVEKPARENDENVRMSGRQTPINELDFVIRYFVGLSEDMVIQYEGLMGDRYYKIVSINEEFESRRKGYIRITGQKFDLEK